jgi:hypothetical protein
MMLLFMTSVAYNALGEQMARQFHIDIQFLLSKEGQQEHWYTSITPSYMSTFLEVYSMHFTQQVELGISDESESHELLLIYSIDMLMLLRFSWYDF